MRGGGGAAQLVTKRSLDRQALCLEPLCCCVLSPLLGEDPEVTERRRDAPQVAELPADCQALCLERLCGLTIAPGVGHGAQGAEGVGDAESVAQRSLDRQALLQERLRPLVVALTPGKASRRIQRPSPRSARVARALGA